MDTVPKIFILCGAAIAIALVFINIYLAGIVGVIVAVIAMSFMIMQDTQFHPEITVRLRDDAKGIIIANTGNSPAIGIHVAVVPLNLEFDIPSLSEDSSFVHNLPEMVRDIKVVVTYENQKSVRFTHSEKLSSMNGEWDPFTPLVPLFKGK